MSLSQDQLRVLNSLRQQLSQCAIALGTAKADLERSDPMPAWSDIMQNASMAALMLNQYQDIMNTHRDFLSSLHSFPLPSFPGAQKEDLLGLLMRKKLDPKAEDWIAEYSKPDPARETGMSKGDLKELWDWAGPTSNQIVKDMMESDVFEDDYTIAEREAGVENVITGLRRKLGDDADSEDDEDGDGDETMEDAVPSQHATKRGEGEQFHGPSMPLETMLRFVTTGALPPAE